MAEIAEIVGCREHTQGGDEDGNPRYMTVCGARNCCELPRSETDEHREEHNEPLLVKKQTKNEDDTEADANGERSEKITTRAGLNLGAGIPNGVIDVH